MKLEKKKNNFRYGKQIPVRTEKLDENNISLLEKYDCGNYVLNETFQTELLSDTKSTSFLIIDNSNNNVICVYTLCCASIVVSTHNNYYMNPAVEIKFFALDTQYQHMDFDENTKNGRLSSHIFSDVLRRIIEFTHNECGADIVLLYSTPKAVGFYRPFGFNQFRKSFLINCDSFLEGCTPMYMNL